MANVRRRHLRRWSSPATVSILLLTSVTVPGLTSASTANATGSPAPTHAAAAAAASQHPAKPPGKPTRPKPAPPAEPFHACRKHHNHYARPCHGHGDHDLPGGTRHT